MLREKLVPSTYISLSYSGINYLSVLDGVTLVSNGDGGARLQKQLANSIQLALQVGCRGRRVAQIAEQIVAKEKYATICVPLLQNRKAADSRSVI